MSKKNKIEIDKDGLEKLKSLFHVPLKMAAKVQFHSSSSSSLFSLILFKNFTGNGCMPNKLQKILQKVWYR